MPKLRNGRRSAAVESLESRRLLSGIYTVIPIGTGQNPGGLSSNGIVALSGNNGQGSPDIFLWHDGQMTDLGSNGAYTTAGGVNSSGDVIGESEMSAGNDHAFYYADGQFHEIPPLDGVTPYDSFGQGINDAGVIVGQCSTLSGNRHGFVGSIGGGTPTDIGTLADAGVSGATSNAYAVNAGGTVAGEADYSYLNGVAVSYSGGLMPYGNLPGGTGSQATAISDNGFIVGTAASQSLPAYPHAVRVVGSGLVDLGSLAGANSESDAAGVNNSGDIVGKYIIDALLNSRAFIYTGAMMVNLNTLLPAGTTVTLTSAIAINNAGEILCTGMGGADGAAAYLLKPSGDVNNLDVPTTNPTNTSPLAATISKSTVPTALVAGNKLKGAVTVNITNTSTATVTGLNTLALYATSNGTIDSSSVMIGTGKSSPKLKPNTSSPAAIHINAPILLSGTYTILARITDASGGKSTSATGPTLTIAAAHVSLSATLTAAPPLTIAAGKAFTVSMIVTNAGNIAATGRATLAISLPTDPQVVAAPVITIMKNLTVKTGSKPLTVKLRLKIPSSQAAGVFYPFITITQGAATFTVFRNTAVTIT